MKKFLFWWPIAVLVIIFGALFVTNYHPGTYLLGWDTTSPELNLGLNFKRYIFAIWQEYRGLGSTDGQSYTANIVHWFYIAFLSLFLPQNLVRYTFTLLTHLVGGIGLYVLLKTEVLPTVLKIQKKEPQDFQGRLSIIGLIGALLYQFNFMTIQMFYTPFETFTIHFAFIPWGIWALLKFFKQKNVQSLLLLAVVNVLGVSQAQVPTVFIAYGLLFMWFFIIEVLFKRTVQLRAIIAAAVVLVLINSFWGIPYVYSTITKANEIANSKQNRYSSIPMFYRNKAYGDITSLASFGSFNLDYLSWSESEKKVIPLMGEWEKKYNSPLFRTINYSFFVISILGAMWALILSIKLKNTYLLGFVTSFIFFFGLLAVNVPGFKDFFEFLQKLIPLFGNVFRAPFTKFSTIYVALLAVLVSFVLFQILTQPWIKNIKRLIVVPIFAVCLIAIFMVSDLSFKNSFFYSELFVTPPKQYKDSFKFLASFGNQHRAIYLPMHSFWGWLTNTNNWGYLGSGFIWQAIPQPLHYRSFDSWNKHNETSFLQLSHALYQFNPLLFQKLSTKYHSDLLFFEKSIVPYGSDRINLFYTESENLIAQIPNTKAVSSFEDLELYLLDTKGQNLYPYAPNSVATIKDTYTTEYTHIDQAYDLYGNYISESTGIEFPFSHLQKQEIYSEPYQLQNNELVFSINKESNQNVVFPSLYQSTKSLPAGIYVSSSSAKTITFVLRPQLPTVLDENQQPIVTPKEVVVEITKPKNEEMLLEVAGAFYFINQKNISSDQFFIGLVALPTKNPFDFIVFESDSNQETDNYVKVSSQELSIGGLITQIDNSLKNLQNGSNSLSIHIPVGKSNDFAISAKELLKSKISQQLNCSPFQEGEVLKQIQQSTIKYFSNNGAVLCEDVLPNLNPGFEYLYFVEADIEKGQGIRQYLVNSQSGRTDLEFVLTGKNSQVWFPILPSQQPLPKPENNGFRLVTNVESFGNEQNTVLVKEMQFVSLPLSWLTQIRTEPTDTAFTQRFDTTINTYQKMANFNYQINVTVKSERGLLVLPQSIDPGWAAFSPTNGFAQLEKVTYNGWANAWYIPKGENYTVYVFFWPQFLVFGGYFLLFTTLGILVLKVRAAHLQKRRSKHFRESKLLPIKQVLSQR